MESINKLPGQIMGLEILRFENAEVEKFNGSRPVFSGFGPLSVLYFPTLNRFVLQVNDWRYPLLRRLPISGGQNESELKSYTLPGSSGSSYELNIHDNANLGSLSNFEAVLMGSSRFSFKGEDMSSRKYETSPDDKLVRQVKAQPGITDAISGTISGAFKSAGSVVKGATNSVVSGTKSLTKKLRSNKSTVTMKDFKKDAKSSFKKDYFSSSQKFSEDFMSRRKNNAFNSTGKPFADMMKASDKTVPALYFFQSDIEESILSAKERFALPPSDTTESKGLMSSIRSGIAGVTDSISSRIHGGQERGRTAEQATTKLPETEGMIHYQG